MFSKTAIQIENLGKCYHIYENPHDRLKQFFIPRLQRALGIKEKKFYREYWALKDITFNIQKGETVAIIGRNGSGKSTLLQLICETLSATQGSIKSYGRIAALLELGSGFNPEFTGHENIYMNAAVLGLNKKEIDDRYTNILDFADIGEFIHQPVKTYSSGMMVRLAFSVAIHVTPDILIVDEALSVGDAYFQAKCANKIQEIISSGATVLFVSHDTASVKSLCNRAILLESGIIKYIGDVNTAVEKYYSSMVQGKNVDIKVGSEGNASHQETLEISYGMDKFQSTARFQRIQNGLAEFINVALTNESGEIVESIEFGQKVILRQVIKVKSHVERVGLAYHIRDKNGQDIIYSDTGIEGEQHIISPSIGSIHIIEWKFTAYLRDGNYVISSMLSEPINLKTSNVNICDFIPISAQFATSTAGTLPIYSAAYWKNELRIREIKDGKN